MKMVKVVKYGPLFHTEMGAAKWEGRKSHMFLKAQSVANPRILYKAEIFNSDNPGLGGNEIRYYQDGKWYKVNVYTDLLIGFQEDRLK